MQSDDSCKKYFSFFSPDNNFSDKDLDLQGTDSPTEKKLKTYLKERQETYKSKKIEDMNNETMESEISELSNLLGELGASDEKNKTDIMEALSYALTEMTDFMLHEPDQHFSLSEQDREQLHKSMISTMKNMGVSEEQSVLCESVFPEVVSQLELLMAKLKTPRV